MRRELVFVSACLILTTGFAMHVQAQTLPAQSNDMAAAKAPFKSAYANPVDDPSLPRVLIIGDSISIAYTIPVRKELQGQANVHRPPTNCGHTGTGLLYLSQWLGSSKWDVIHFNWGIWDTHYLYKNNNQMALDESKITPDEVKIRYTPDQYRQNLMKLVEILKKTNARLIWASTTPIMSRTGDRFYDIARYNEVAIAVMKENGIPIDDLYSPALANAMQWQLPDKVHFGTVGSQKLGLQVAESIREALKKGK